MIGANTNDQAFQEFLKLLDELDLSPIRYKLMNPEEGIGWSVDKAQSVELGYRVFLLLNMLYPGRSIVPNKDIDAFWHYHILDTELYSLHCQLLFGRMLHHFPYFGMRGEADRQALEDSFEETKLLFEQHGGAIEGFGAACGSDCGSSLCDVQTCDTNECTPAPGPDDDYMSFAIDRDRLRSRIQDIMSVRPRA